HWILPVLLHWIDFLQGCVVCTYPCSKTKFSELVFWLAKAAVTAKATANTGNAHLNFKFFMILKFKFIIRSTFFYRCSIYCLIRAPYVFIISLFLKISVVNLIDYEIIPH